MTELESATSVRKAVLNELHRRCGAVGLEFYMCSHFIERLNVRTHDEEATFRSFLGAVVFVLTRVNEFDGQKICIEANGHFFYMRPELDRKQLACITYYFNAEKIRPGVYDRKFKLKS